jgi:hypothetical protein
MHSDAMSTVMGAFDDINSARMTVDELQMAGYDGDEVRLIEARAAATGATRLDDATLDRVSGTDESEEGHDDVRGVLTRILLGIDLAPDIADSFGDDASWWPDDDAQRYFEDLRLNGRHVIMVSSADDLDEALRILKHNGADVEGRAGGWLSTLSRRWKKRRSERRSELRPSLDQGEHPAL